MTDSFVCIDLETTGLDPKRDRIIEIGAVKVEQGKVIAEILPELFAFLGNHVLLGHSVLFDFAFLKKAAVNERLAFERKGIDTLKIARKYLKELESRSLEFLCRHYDIPHKAHRALEDARATVLLYRKLSEEFYEKEEEAGEKSLFCPKPLLYQVKRDTPITIPQKEQLYKLLDKHKLIVDYEVESLTRSEASRKIDRILAEYGR